MINTRCPIEFYTALVTVLQRLPQYHSIAQSLEDECCIQEDNPPVGNPITCSEDVQGECENDQSYGSQEIGNITPSSCPAQRALERMELRNSPEMIKKCIDAVQNICDTFVELCKLQTAEYTESHQNELDEITLELEKFRANQQPSQKEINDILTKINNHLQIIVDFVEAAINKWFGFSQRRFAHAALKFLNDMVQELKNGKSTSKSINHYEERFKKLLEDLKCSVEKDNKIAAGVVGIGGGILTVVAAIFCSSFGVAFGGAVLTAVAAYGTYKFLSID